MSMSARQYRRSARLHATKAVALLTSRPGLTLDQREAALKAAVSHLGNAMAHASAAVALTEQAGQPLSVNVEDASAELIKGLEELLAENEK